MPISAIALYDAEAVDPYISYTHTLCELYSVLECLGQVVERYEGLGHLQSCGSNGSGVYQSRGNPLYGCNEPGGRNVRRILLLSPGVG